jgi:outer membrane protein assembly factor BamB
MKTIISLLIILMLLSCADNNNFQAINNKKIHTKWNISRLSGHNQQYTAFTPVQDYDAIYFTGKSGRIYKADSNSGLIIDEINTKLMLSGGLALSSNTVFVTTQNAKIVAINKTTHKILWQADLPTIAIETPLVNSNVVIVKTNDAQILVFDIDTGKKIWVYNSNPPNLTLYNNHSMTIVNNELLLSGFPDGKMVLFSITNGNIIWEQILKSTDNNERLKDISTAPIISNDTVFVANYSGGIYCLDLFKGTIVWNRNIGSPISNIHINNQQLFVASASDKALYNISISSGKIVWKKNFDREIINLANLESYLLATDIKGYIHLINSDTGQVIEESKIAQSGYINSITSNNASSLIMQGQNGELSFIEIY